jgi:hypothetical protein
VHLKVLRVLPWGALKLAPCHKFHGVYSKSNFLTFLRSCAYSKLSLDTLF